MLWEEQQRRFMILRERISRVRLGSKKASSGRLQLSGRVKEECELSLWRGESFPAESAKGLWQEGHSKWRGGERLLELELREREQWKATEEFATRLGVCVTKRRWSDLQDGRWIGRVEWLLVQLGGVVIQARDDCSPAWRVVTEGKEWIMQ